ncbi:MAG: hypothetical protein R6V05_01845 [Candidatus Brocadiia bacterium]
MKKVLIIAGVLVGAVLVFFVSAVVTVNVLGGLPPGQARLAEAPLVGGLLKVRQPAEEDTAEGEQAQGPQQPAGRRVPFLRFGPEARLNTLAQELEAKKKEYDSLLRKLERRGAELDAWEGQLEKEREAVRTRFVEERAALDELRAELDGRRRQLDALQVRISEAEESNLKKTADIYSKMSPQKAAQILAQLYGDGETETVVKIIYLMQDRSAAKALEAITDPKMSADITQRLKSITETNQEGT